MTASATFKPVPDDVARALDRVTVDDLWWWSRDGVRLHARRYRPTGGREPLPLILLPGLTRNARDFEWLAPRLADAGHQVLAADLRGRGESGHAPDPLTYDLLVYAQDIVALIEAAGVARVGLVGTSLGGLVALLLAAQLPEAVAGVILNDVGPTLDPVGVARIVATIGQPGSQSGPQPTWMHAARAVEAALATMHPDFTIHDWLRMAKRQRRLTPEGRIVPDHDPQIALPLRRAAQGGGGAGRGSAGAVDLWAAFRALGDARLPLMTIRGALSDILSAETLRAMAAEAPVMTCLTLERVGHAPTLDEPAAVAAILPFAAALA